MSVYQHAHYPPPSQAHLAHPVHPMPQYQYPQAVPLPMQVPVAHPGYYMDANSFRQEYSARLKELTVNSRPIIQNLSILAHEYTRYSGIVAQCIETHIRMAAPWMKLPAFYLLDMISKNIYEPYARQFSGFVIPLFLESYHAVDPPTRSKMEELLLTWRTGGPNNKELFGAPAQVSIESGIWGDASSLASSSRVTKSQVLTELDYTLGQRQRALQLDPHDATAHQHVTALTQLRNVVMRGVSQDELQQILTQLRNLISTPNPVPPPVASVHSWSSYQVPSAINNNIPTSASPTYSTLLTSLLKSGVVSSNSGTSIGAGSSIHEQEENPVVTADMERDAEQSYHDLILSHTVQLSTNGITQTSPAMANILYASNSIQCKQCGLRYADNPVGKDAHQQHLDMHFRQNRKANENMGRGHSRSWFTDVEDWINDVTDVKGKGKEGARRISAKEVAAAERSKRDAELRAQFVIVREDSAKDVSCPICKELLKSVFKEDDEDWVWYNAVERDGRVYHATCYAETATNTLAAKILSQPRSRSRTPELTRSSTPRVGLKRESLSPPPQHVLKRKADSGHEESPPAKKKVTS